MTLSKREKNIALGLGATLGLLVLYEVVIQPYRDSLAQINTDYKAAVSEYSDDTSLADRRVRFTPIWKEITDGGLSADQSVADNSAWNSASDWASSAGVTITSLKSGRTTDANPFVIIGYHLTGNGSTPAIARLLKSFETATIPVRVDNIQVTPLKEGTDNLQLQMSFSTLCLKADADAKTTVTRANAEAQPWN
jgi:Type II secretion system (T2SS), protein M subtype b